MNAPDPTGCSAASSPSALGTIAAQLVADDKGLLAIDESTATCNQRFAQVGIAQTEAKRRAWRGLLIATPGLSESISGVILVDETIYQRTPSGQRFADVLQDAGIAVGIKVDTGAKDLALHPGEKVTEGLDGLRDRLLNYRDMGARFAKWRAVFSVKPSQGDDAAVPAWPSRACIDANAHALARYAAMCQEAGLVPVVEPEVLMHGRHTLAQCGAATEVVLRALFAQLAVQGVALDAMVLKPNMVLPGLDAAAEPSADEVADATLHCLRCVVPAAVAGIAFLSGGQTPADATARLNAINLRATASVRPAPWPLAFSFARALQEPALAMWRGDDAHHHAAQQALKDRAAMNREARRGAYDAALDAR
jgi:fructose-bisphosphate aldolase, class I